MGYNSCVGLGICKSDLSEWKVFGCSEIERQAIDNPSYMGCPSTVPQITLRELL